MNNWFQICDVKANSISVGSWFKDWSFKIPIKFEP